MNPTQKLLNDLSAMRTSALAQDGSSTLQDHPCHLFSAPCSAKRLSCVLRACMLFLALLWSVFSGASSYAQTNTAPQVIATPVAYSEAPYQTHDFYVTYRDAQGTGDLSTCWFGVNTVATWTRAV
ncbi:hypothetical protein IAD21_01841 [Abditibacteriota bacterium]|nr:hypothetical protein IAD21_01841 [Abditibacteriota bacterium]